MSESYLDESYENSNSKLKEAFDLDLNTFAVNGDTIFQREVSI